MNSVRLGGMSDEKTNKESDVKKGKPCWASGVCVCLCISVREVVTQILSFMLEHEVGLQGLQPPVTLTPGDCSCMKTVTSSERRPKAQSAIREQL